jgi:hypothetical protein
MGKNNNVNIVMFGGEYIDGSVRDKEEQEMEKGERKQQRRS